MLAEATNHDQHEEHRTSTTSWSTAEPGRASSSGVHRLSDEARQHPGQLDEPDEVPVHHMGSDESNKSEDFDSFGEEGVDQTALGQVAGLFVGPNKHQRSIEQGHPGIRAFAFAGSVASFILCLFSVFNPMVLFGSPIVWAIAAYQGVFSISTLIFEAKPEWVSRLSSGLEVYQDYVLTNASFLARSFGRGLFYIFQGTLWASVGYSLPLPENAPLAHLFLWFFQIATHVLGFFFILVGIAHVLMHFGIMPQHYVHKVKRGSVMVTERVGNALDNLRDRRQAREASGQDDAPPSRAAGSSSAAREVELPQR